MFSHFVALQLRLPKQWTSEERAVCALCLLKKFIKPSKTVEVHQLIGKPVKNSCRMLLEKIALARSQRFKIFNKSQQSFSSIQQFHQL